MKERGVLEARFSLQAKFSRGNLTGASAAASSNTNILHEVMEIFQFRLQVHQFLMCIVPSDDRAEDGFLFLRWSAD